MHAGEDDKAALTEPTKADSIAHESEPPLPPYSRAHPADLNGRPAAEQSVNWLNVSRENESIRGTYVVDPQLEIPAALLALPSTEGGRGNKDKERMNLVLETKEGDIDVTVHIVGENGNADGLPGSSAEIEQKVKVKMRSFKGSVTCRIVPIDESNDLGQAVTRPRFIVYASADNGINTMSLEYQVYTNNTHDFDEDEGESPPSVDDKALLLDKEVAEATAEEETRVAPTDDTEPIAEDEGLAICDEGPAVPEAEGMAVDDPLIAGKDVEDTTMDDETVAEGVFAVEEIDILELVEASTEEEIAGVLDTAEVPEDKKVPGVLESVTPVRS
ncbi:hypothetical protein EYR36_003342 [Pleurotus pulmonarius]|nr:hypothetical protein EYR36_003342 [Pleurotus pulmonarius]